MRAYICDLHLMSDAQLAMLRATTMTNSYSEIFEKMKQSLANPATPSPSTSSGPSVRLLNPPASFPERADILARVHYELAKMHESGRLAQLDQMFLRDLPAKASCPASVLRVRC
jgi:hypothetical protein